MSKRYSQKSPTTEHAKVLQSCDPELLWFDAYDQSNKADQHQRDATAASASAAAASAAASAEVVSAPDNSTSLASKRSRSQSPKIPKGEDSEEEFPDFGFLSRTTSLPARKKQNPEHGQMHFRATASEEKDFIGAAPPRVRTCDPSSSASSSASTSPSPSPAPLMRTWSS